jgi:hypothetical protein
MINPRARPVRRRVGRVICENCKTSFIAKRAEARFCKEACEKARSRELKRKAELLFKEKQSHDNVIRIGRINKGRSDWSEQWSRYGEHRERWASDMATKLAHDYKTVRFIGTNHGIYAIEDKPGALQLVLDECPWRDILGDDIRVVECDPKDPKVLDAVCPPLRGGFKWQRTRDAKLRPLILKGVTRVILFAFDIEVRPPTNGLWYESASPRDPGRDHHEEDAEPLVPDLDDIFGPGGYSIE